MIVGNDLQGSVRISDTPQERLKVLHDTNGLSWRQIAQISDYATIPPGSLSTFAKTGFIAKRYRALLGLPPVATVIVVSGEIIPDGTQVKRADYCECGAPYSPDHPRRKHCYRCNPGKSAHATR